MNDVNPSNSAPADRLPPEKVVGQVIQAPGVLILAWSLWLLGSWGVTLLLDPSVRAVRWMIFAGLFGLMAVYPAVRLSQTRMIHDGEQYHNHPLSRLRVLFDWFALYAVFQAVVWPLRVSTDWSIEQTFWLDAAIGAWSLLVAACVAFAGTFTGGWARIGGMLLCLVILIGEPAAMAWVNVGAGEGQAVSWQMMLSPLQITWSLSGPAITFEPGRYPAHIMTVAGFAVAAWLGIGIFGFLRKK